MSKPRVLITVPNGKAWIHKLVAFSCLRLLQDPRFDSRLQLPTHTPYINNLHKCRREFLDGPYDYWLSMDDDNPPPGNALDLVLDMISDGLDIVGLPTPVWHSAKRGDRPFYFNALNWDARASAFRPADLEAGAGLQEVDAIGSGCFIVSRRVMEAIPAPFMRTWDDDGIVTMGGDFSFCKRATDAGFRIYVDPRYRCEHMNELPLNEVIESFAAMGVTSG